MRHVHSRNAVSGILDTERRPILDGIDPERHRAARFRESDRVVQQVCHQLSEPRRVAVDRHGSRSISDQVHSFFFGKGVEHFTNLTGQNRQVHRLPPNGDFSSIRPRQQKQAVHESRQPLALFAQRCEDVPVFIGFARILQDDLDRRPHRSQRSP